MTNIQTQTKNKTWKQVRNLALIVTQYKQTKKHFKIMDMTFYNINSIYKNTAKTTILQKRQYSRISAIEF